MAENSKIEWTTHTFNPWRGCSKVAEGCANCYAATDALRFPKNRGIWGPNGTRVLAADSMWRKPLAWNRQSEIAHERYEDYCIAGAGVGVWNGPIPSRPRVFCASLADVFEDWQGMIHDHNERVMWTDGECMRSVKADNHMLEPWRPATIKDVRKRLFALIDSTPWLDWQLVTKRPENIRKMWPTPYRGTCVADFGMDPGITRENVWLITSVSEQSTADRNIPELLKCRNLSPVLGVSYEPALGPVDFDSIWPGGMCSGSGPYAAGIDWVIVGGESGHAARPCNLAWVRSTIRQCDAANVPCFVKQIGSYAVFNSIRGESDRPTRDSKGGDPKEWPSDLCVRQFPRAEQT